MESVSIKVNQPEAAARKPSLKTKSGGLPTMTKTKTSRLVWLLVVGLLIISAGLGYLWLTKKEASFEKIIPSDRTAIVYFQPEKLLEQFKSFQEKGLSLTPFSWVIDFAKYITQSNNLSGLDAQIGQIFGAPMAAALLNSPALPPRWVFLAEIKMNSADFNSRLEKIEKNLELRYNLITESYRQIKITRVKHLNTNPNDIYYTNLKNYFLISDDIEVVKKTINNILD